MKPEDFMQKALEGGWRPEGFLKVSDIYQDRLCYFRDKYNAVVRCWLDLNIIIIDPKAWEAVGKVEGWRKKVCSICGYGIPQEGELGISECCADWMRGEPQESYKYHMHAMIDARIEGKSIGDYLETL